MSAVLLNRPEYYDTFDSFLDVAGEKYGTKPAVTWFGKDGSEYTKNFLEFVSDVRKVQKALELVGFQGKNIAIAGENCYEWIIAYFAIAASGGCVVCIDAEQPDTGIRQMLEQSEVKGIFASQSVIRVCDDYISRCAGGSEVILLTGTDNQHRTFETFMAEGAAAGEPAKVMISPEQTASLVFTSGTTSLSKMVMLSHRAILHNASNSIAHVDAKQRVFSSLPFYHAYGMTCAVIATILRGAHLLINGNLRTVMRDLHLSKAESMLTVPLMLETIHNGLWREAKSKGQEKDLEKVFKIQKMLRMIGKKTPIKPLEAVREKCMGTLKVIICGGAHLNREVAEEFDLMGVTILQGYGITECSPLVAVNCNKSYRLDSVGYVLPECEVSIIEGEICVRGIMVMNGYYKEPEQTEEAMKDGWFCTGDLGYIDKDGFLYITGRKKNLIVLNNGKKISPEKMEDMIKKIDIVQDVMVYGAKNGSRTDDVRIAASIYPDPALTGKMQQFEILSHLQKEIDAINATLPLYQQIQMINIREQEFEKTATKKIKRYTV